MNEYERTAQSLKARIAALRSSLRGGIESFKASQVHRTQYTPERPQEEERVHPKLEPDWDAIAKLTASNDEKEAKEAELNALKSKLKGNKK